MARLLRLEFEDAIYHLLARRNARQQVSSLGVGIGTRGTTVGYMYSWEIYH